MAQFSRTSSSACQDSNFISLTTCLTPFLGTVIVYNRDKREAEKTRART